MKLVSSPEQWSVIASPTRFEIVEAMRDLAPCGISAIAGRLRVKPDTLYRHIELLKESGFVVPAGFRKASRGAEQLFDLTADDFQIDFDTTTDKGPANDTIADTAAVFLKRVGKVIRRTAAARGFDTTPGGKNAAILCDYANLTREQYRELTALIGSIKQLLDRSRGKRGETGKPAVDQTQLYSVLLTAVPVITK